MIFQQPLIIIFGMYQDMVGWMRRLLSDVMDDLGVDFGSEVEANLSDFFIHCHVPVTSRTQYDPHISSDDLPITIDSHN
jgi:hypothetical protein